MKLTENNVLDLLTRQEQSFDVIHSNFKVYSRAQVMKVLGRLCRMCIVGFRANGTVVYWRKLQSWESSVPRSPVGSIIAPTEKDAPKCST